MRDARPSHLLIDTRCPENKWEPRYPVAEGHFPDACLQPYVHTCMVNICEGRREYSLALFFKNHVRLPVNTSLAALHCAVAFRGDIIVMRPAAADHRSFVNMRGRDSALSDFAVIKYFLLLLLSFGCQLNPSSRRFVEYISQNPKHRMPKALTFHKPLVSGQRRSMRERYPIINI